MAKIDKDYNTIYLRKGQRAAALLRLVPSILLVGISGSISQGLATKKSDIDFFVVSRRGRIFSSRFWAKFLLTIIGWSRKNHDLNPAGKICLNYFLSEDSLDFKPHNSKVVEFHQKSIILFSRGDIPKRLTLANAWLKPRFNLINHKIISGNSSRSNQTNWLEKWLKSYQIRRIERDPLTNKFPDKIIFNDLELRFHPPRKARS